MKKAKTFSQGSVLCFYELFLGNNMKKCQTQTETWIYMTS
jgi:hypothetical protein